MEDLLFLLAHLHAVREGCAGAEQTEIPQEGEVVLAIARSDGPGLTRMLRGMGVNTQPLGLGPLPDFSQETLGAGKNEAGVVGEEKPILPPVKAPNELLAFGQRILAVPGKALGKARDAGIVHEGVPQNGADRMVQEFFKNGAGVPDRFHALEGRAAAPKQFINSDAGRLAEGLGTVFCLQGPNLFAQPGEEGAVLGEAAKESLAEVNMGLDEAGEGVESAEGADLFAGERAEVPDVLDFTLLDAEGSVQDVGSQVSPPSWGVLRHGDEMEALEE